MSMFGEGVKRGTYKKVLMKGEARRKGPEYELQKIQVMGRGT